MRAVPPRPAPLVPASADGWPTGSASLDCARRLCPPTPGSGHHLEVAPCSKRLHDTISLPKSEFASFAAVLHDATYANGNATITAGNDTLTLDNLTKTQLAAAQADFTFHA